jgi:phosphohistidine phosphatase
MFREEIYTMLIYLVRHGEALSEQENPERPLSTMGKRNIQRLGAHLAQHVKMLPGHIYHSSKARAVQTATILSQSLPNAPEPVQADGLMPMDDPGLWVERLASADRDIMLVGHMPYMSRLASLLITWDTGKEIADFTPGTIVCLEKSSSYRIKWMMTPRMLKSEGPS